MYKSFLLLLVLFAVLSVRAQDLRSLDMNSEPDQGERPPDVEHTAITDSIEPNIVSWTLAKQFSSKLNAEVDTTTINFHIYNPIFKKSISNNHLGFLGAPYESNIFFERDNYNHFYFMRSLNAYYRSSEDIRFYNSTTPHSSLYYSQGSQGTSRAEQYFKAFYTQNLDSITNLGMEYNVIKNFSQYINQESHHKFLNLFISRNSERYNGYFSILRGQNNLVENGGIVAKRIDVDVPESIILLSKALGTNIGINNTATSPYSLAVNLPQGIELNNKSFTVFTSHEYKLGQLPFFDDEVENDTLAVEFEPRYSIQYSAELNTHKRHLIESSVNASFFDSTFMNNLSNTDSSSFTRFSHIFQLNAFENNERRFAFTTRAFVENEIIQAGHPIPFGQREYSYSNLYLGGEISKETSEFWNWYVLSRFAVLGRNLGDALIKGAVEKPIMFFSDTTRFNVEAWYSDVSADIYQEHWYSNHFKWENDFKKQHEVVIKAKFDYPRFKASAGADYALYSNFLYNNAQALPDQFNGEFSVLAAWLNKDFSLGRFHWSNRVVWQAVSNDAALRLPTLSAYSSLYYSHYLFKVMQIQLGADVYYHTPFKANKYEPSTTRFYIQNEITTGAYPIINLYANAKLKRTSAFVQMVHANSMFKFGEFFSTPHYPLEQMLLRFGILWTFYD
jgi:hypothetical protein